MDKKILVAGDKKFCEEIKSVIGFLGVEMFFEQDLKKISGIIGRADVSMVIFDDDTLRRKNKKPFYYTFRIFKNKAKNFIIVSSDKKHSSIFQAAKSGAAEYIIKPYSQREFIARFNAVYLNWVRIVCIGGGTGLFHMLAGLRKLPKAHLSSVVNMSDDGGSSGRLKASFGVLPPGDVRRSLVALSNAPEVMNRLIQYRFTRGGFINGHNLGNLLLTALSDIKGSFTEAVRSLGDVLNVRGAVLPIIDTKTTLCARFENGKVIRGESRIDLCKGRSPQLHIQDIWHDPRARCNVDALSAILHSDIIIIGPGDLFTSIITNFLVKDICKAILKSKAKKIYVCNLMTKPGETFGYDVDNHVYEIVKYLNADCLDYVVISDTPFSQTVLRKYARKQQFPVKLDGAEKINSITKAKLVFADVSHQTELLRHDSDKMMRVISNIIKDSK